MRWNHSTRSDWRGSGQRQAITDQADTGTHVQANSTAEFFDAAGSKAAQLDFPVARADSA